MDVPTPQISLRKREKSPTLPAHLIDGWMQYNAETYCFLQPCNTCARSSICDHEPAQLSLAGQTVNIRRAIRARPNHTIVAIDFQGIEIRVAANLAKEKVWIDAIGNGRDLHTEMASLGFKKPLNEVTKDERGIAKTMTFGNIYGGTSNTLARQSGRSLEEATQMWNAWWAAVPDLKIWTEVQKAIGRKQGYIDTYFGRRRSLKGFIERIVKLKQASDEKGAWQEQGYMDRTCTNSPIQGTAADILKIAAVRVDSRIRKDKLQGDCDLLLLVHDEAVFEIANHSLKPLATLMANEMVFPITNWPLSMGVDVEYGENWGDLEKLEIDKPVNQTSIKQPELTKNPSVEEWVTMDIDTQLTQETAAIVKQAIMSSPGGEKLKIIVGGKDFIPKASVKVSSIELRRKLAAIQGIQIVDGKQVCQLK